MSKKQAQLAAVPLGGVGEIGMNLMVYEYGNEMIVVDTGVMFADANTPGVDVIVPDTRYIRDNIDKLKGVFITHAHEDHIGAIGYLWDDFGDVPVFVSPFAKYVLDDKLSKVGIKPAKGRVNVVREGKSYKAGSFEVEYVGISHSILEAYSLAIRTPLGLVLHTGDYKLDDNPLFKQATNVARFKELGEEGVLAFLGDSTNVFNPNPAGSEGDLAKRLAEQMKGIKGRIVLAAFASNTGRVLAAFQAAAKQGRKICCLGRTVNNMIQYAKGTGYFPEGLGNYIVSPDEAAQLADDKVLIFASGTQGEPQASLSRLAEGNNVRGIKLKKGDTVIMSSKMIPGNERPILNVINLLLRQGVVVKNELTDHDIHVSGHGGRPEIEQMYAYTKPQIVVPVHGEFAHLQEQARVAKEAGVPTQLQILNGDKAVLAPEPKVVRNHAFAGRSFVDGYAILDKEDQFIIDERKKLMYNGVVSVAIARDSETFELVSDASISTQGLIDVVTNADVIEQCISRITEVLEVTFPDNRLDDTTRAGEVITQVVRKVFSTERGKKPVIMVNVVES